MKELVFRFSIFLVAFGICLYFYLEKQNELTELKIKLPEMEKKIARIEEENQRLTYQIDRFESPTHLIELAHHPEYAHLKHPLLQEILTVPEAFASNR